MEWLAGLSAIDLDEDAGVGFEGEGFGAIFAGAGEFEGEGRAVGDLEPAGVFVVVVWGAYRNGGVEEGGEVFFSSDDSLLVPGGGPGGHERFLDRILGEFFGEDEGEGAVVTVLGGVAHGGVVDIAVAEHGEAFV